MMGRMYKRYHETEVNSQKKAKPMPRRQNSEKEQVRGDFGMEKAGVTLRSPSIGGIYLYMKSLPVDNDASAARWATAHPKCF